MNAAMSRHWNWLWLPLMGLRAARNAHCSQRSSRRSMEGRRRAYGRYGHRDSIEGSASFLEREKSFVVRKSERGEA